MARCLFYLLCAAAVILLLISVAAFVYGSNFLYSRHEDIGLMTGRIRHTETILGMHFRSSVQPSAITKELGIQDSVQENLWKRVNTFSFNRRISPHYIYHSALSQLSSLEMAWSILPYTAEGRKLSARALLDEWLIHKNDTTATDLVTLYIDFDDSKEITAEVVQDAIDRHNAAILSKRGPVKRGFMHTP